ncbi:glycosyltransferase [Halopelagius longus]|uniref:Glycosyl transferase family 21 n=1 Tax=Halopelagius longus TaxID=1236180 RepID=A0A1H0YN04_9EURY|nr:glycosyltransferase [Halopelagius longus]RDI72571.1 glycosyltransferase [Halopelagius longus]SDQ16341.1 Glycosyl transferase family 21 [Halopelagius longus]
MASVILPSNRWTDGAADVAADVREDDELLVVCDSENASVVSDAPDEVTVLVAGDPEGCAGKANALAYGMERATHDVVVWTDDDVSRDSGWRDRLVSMARNRGAATEVPVYVGGGIWPLLEPAFVLLGSLGLVEGGFVWGGGVAFDRTEIDEDALRSDLRRTVGDDSVLSTYLDDPWADEDHPREVPVSGAPGDVYDRIARFAKAAYFFDRAGTSVLLAASFVAAALFALFPVFGVVAATTLAAAGYAKLGVRRASVVLAYPSVLCLPVALLAGILAPRFEWGGRRYEWRDAFDVRVVDDE